jgi:hypothetical protein
MAVLDGNILSVDAVRMYGSALALASFGRTLLTAAGSKVELPLDDELESGG